MKTLLLAMLLTVGLAGVLGISKETYPNPAISPGSCWRYGSATPANLKVCDPDRLIEESDAKKLQEAVKTVSLTTACPCDTPANPYQCQIWRLGGDPSGYKLSVALVKSMEDVNSNKVDAAAAYANYLRVSRGYYGHPFGRCEEDVIILLSYDDKVVYVLTGLKAQEKLPDRRVRTLVENSRTKFQTSIYAGLDYIIAEINKALK